MGFVDKSKFDFQWQEHGAALAPTHVLFQGTVLYFLIQFLFTPVEECKELLLGTLL